MKVYLLWWDNGLEYSDHDVQLLGVYYSEPAAVEARDECSMGGNFLNYTIEEQEVRGL